MHSTDMVQDKELLSRLCLFRNVGPESIEVYLERCFAKDVKAGEVLLEPGKDNQHIYSLISGRLQVHLDSLERPPLTSLDPGECAGEMSLIDHKGPSAYVVASEDSRLLVTDQDTLWAMVHASHAVARNLLYILSRRVRFDNVVIADSFELQERYERYATVDALTGLHNRRWLDEMFDREMKRCQVDRQPLCVGMLDVDHFKQFNDRFGHLAGDQVLTTLATALRHQLRPNDMVARYGGEEFCVMLPQTRLQDTLNIAERVRGSIAELEIGRFRGRILPRVTVSIGVTALKADDTLEALLARADAALYRAKEGGRNRVMV